MPLFSIHNDLDHRRDHLDLDWPIDAIDLRFVNLLLVLCNEVCRLEKDYDDNDDDVIGDLPILSFSTALIATMKWMMRVMSKWMMIVLKLMKSNNWKHSMMIAVE